MLFRQLNHDTPCRTYLVADEGSRHAMLIDPVLEHADDYILTLAELGLTLRYVVDTHLHADHRSGAAALRGKTGARYVGHAALPSPCVDVHVEDGSRLELGDLSVTVRHTPGHSADSISLFFADRIVTGDFLLLGDSGAGRTDVGSGDAGAHWDSLQLLEGLGDEVRVYPGHVYRGPESSTLGEQRRTNSRLRPVARADYVRQQEALRIDTPEWMRGVARANAECASDTATVLVPNQSATCEARGSLGDEHRFAAATVKPEVLLVELTGKERPFLLHVGEQARPLLETDVSLSISQILPWALENADLQARPIVVVCDSGVKSARATAILAQAGFGRVRSLEGGTERWHLARVARTFREPFSAA